MLAKSIPIHVPFVIACNVPAIFNSSQMAFIEVICILLKAMYVMWRTEYIKLWLYLVTGLWDSPWMRSKLLVSGWIVNCNCYIFLMVLLFFTRMQRAERPLPVFWNSDTEISLVANSIFSFSSCTDRGVSVEWLRRSWYLKWKPQVHNEQIAQSSNQPEFKLWNLWMRLLLT